MNDIKDRLCNFDCLKFDDYFDINIWCSPRYLFIQFDLEETNMEYDNILKQLEEDYGGNN